jgi:hypothetical protein
MTGRKKIILCIRWKPHVYSVFQNFIITQNTVPMHVCQCMDGRQFDRLYIYTHACITCLFSPLEPEQVINITQAMMKSGIAKRENNDAEDLDLVNAPITSISYDKGPVCNGSRPSRDVPAGRPDTHQAVRITHAGASLPCMLCEKGNTTHMHHPFARRCTIVPEMAGLLCMSREKELISQFIYQLAMYKRA